MNSIKGTLFLCLRRGFCTLRVDVKKSVGPDQWASSEASLYRFSLRYNLGREIQRFAQSFARYSIKIGQMENNIIA